MPTRGDEIAEVMQKVGFSKVFLSWFSGVRASCAVYFNSFFVILE